VIQNIKEGVTSLSASGVFFILAGDLVGMAWEVANAIAQAFTSQRDATIPFKKVHPTEGRHIVVVDPNASCHETLGAAFRATGDAVIVLYDRQCPEVALGKSLLGIYQGHGGRKYCLLGARWEHLKKVLDKLYEMENALASDIASALDIQRRGDIASWLRRLYDLGAVRRQPVVTRHGRLGYTYTVFDPTTPYASTFAQDCLARIRRRSASSPES
jgi:predicted transcriptional regulator